MVILGIDPGMIRLGYAAINTDPLALSKFGMIHTPRTDQTFNVFLNEGIEHITNEFPRVLMFTEPDSIYAETVPPGRLGSNSELVMSAITVCKVIAFQFGIPWTNVAESTWKSKVVGTKDSSKAKTRNAVFARFPELEPQHKALKLEQKAEGEKVEGFPPDITDAIGVAIAGTMVYDSNETT